MCKSKLKLFSKSEHGYIGKCGDCQCYNLVFENIFLLVSENELMGIGQMFESECAFCFMEESIGNDKKITMQTPLPNLYFAFTLDEFVSMRDMVNTAITKIKERPFYNPSFNLN